MKITERLLNELDNCHLLLKSKTLVWFGLSYPLSHGWKRKLIGKEISDASYSNLRALITEYNTRVADKSISKQFFGWD